MDQEEQADLMEEDVEDTSDIKELCTSLKQNQATEIHRLNELCTQINGLDNIVGRQQDFIRLILQGHQALQALDAEHRFLTGKFLAFLLQRKKRRNLF